MIKPFFLFLGRLVSSYGILIAIGATLAGVIAMLICKQKKTLAFDILYSAAFVIIGAFLGAKILFILVSIPIIIENNLSFVDLMQGGFVFYGGFLGGVLALYIYCKCFKESFSS